jgi:hypothetical protein
LKHAFIARRPNYEGWQIKQVIGRVSNEFNRYQSKHPKALSPTGATGFSLFSTLARQFIAWRPALSN